MARPNHAARTRVLVVFASALVLALLPGCHKGQQEKVESAEAARGVSPRPGYDPAWSPDGTRIVYVTARYVRDGELGLVLDNDRDTPTARDELQIWHMHERRSGPLVPEQLGRGRAFLMSPTWLNDSKIVVLLTDRHRTAAGTSSERSAWDWDQIIRYRVLRNALLVVDVRTGQCQWLAQHFGAYLQTERVCDGEIAVWEASSETGEDVALAIRDEDGNMVREILVPRAEWTSSVGAIGTVLTDPSVLVQRVGEGEDCLSRLQGETTEEFYCPGRAISGVFGSPDGEHIAFLENREEAAPGARCDLRVLRVDGGEAVTVAEDAYGESRIAWAPDGRRIAYARSEDGRIAIAEVPPSE